MEGAKGMIFAAFTYYNEVDSLWINIETTKGLVDHYLIAEGDRDFQGVPKSINFVMPDNIEPDRIHHEVVELPVAISDGRTKDKKVLKPQFIERFMKEHKDIWGFGKENWDPEVVSLDSLPDAVKNNPERFGQFFHEVT